MGGGQLGELGQAAATQDGCAAAKAVTAALQEHAFLQVEERTVTDYFGIWRMVGAPMYDLAWRARHSTVMLQLIPSV